MIRQIWEGRYPHTIDKKEVDDFFKNVVRPALEKGGYKRLRFGWMSIGGPTNLGILTGELESLADIDRAWSIKELPEASEEFDRRFRGVEVTKRILEIVE